MLFNSCLPTLCCWDLPKAPQSSRGSILKKRNNKLTQGRCYIQPMQQAKLHSTTNITFHNQSPFSIQFVIFSLAARKQKKNLANRLAPESSLFSPGENKRVPPPQPCPRVLSFSPGENKRVSPPPSPPSLLTLGKTSEKQLFFFWLGAFLFCLFLFGWVSDCPRRI